MIALYNTVFIHYIDSVTMYNFVLYKVERTQGATNSLTLILKSIFTSKLEQCLVDNTFRNVEDGAGISESRS